MIKKRFIDRQIEKSAAGKRTTPFLRRLVFQTVDVVSRSHYAKDYSMKCVQTAAATKMLLAKMGIDSRLTMGAVCFPKILWGGQFAGWTGFWDADHHVWIETEFNEIVDLSMSQLHDHPRTIEREMQTPAIWWEQRNGWPPIIRYLLDTHVDGVDLGNAGDQESYEKFVEKVQAAFSSILADKGVEDVAFSPLLGDFDQLNMWTEEGHPWATAALTVLEYHIPFPPWIAERQQEIETALSQGRYPSSRLSDREDLIRDI